MTLFLLAMVACGNPSGPAPILVDFNPKPVAGTACSVCGMSVDEQPSPRAQAQHRDGSHHHFCSVSELQAWMSAPGPLGAPITTWVEVLPPDLDPGLHDTAPQRWREPEKTWFISVPDRRVMGTPILAYASVQDATQAAAAYNGTAIRWPSLLPLESP